ncbi:MAG: hypothetical protein HN691_08685 [Bacteroidetes bacterium]|jgi:hypothetical protein|nr:hypothetical protein [Bacteroidota bacterium]
MINVEQITDLFVSKLEHIRDYKFILEKEFDEQLPLLKERINSSLTKLQSELNIEDLEKFFSEMRRNKFENEKEVNNVFFKYFVNNKSTIEEYFGISESAMELYNFSIEPDNNLKDMVRRKLDIYWDILEKSKHYLILEELDKVNSCYINFLGYKYSAFSPEYKYFNTKGSLSFYPKEDSGFRMSIYLISESRIVNIILNNKKLISSNEHIIQRDLKKVEVFNDNQIYFHYHGLHKPDVLHMDDYESAIKLRKQISKFREKRFFNNPKTNFRNKNSNE